MNSGSPQQVVRQESVSYIAPENAWHSGRLLILLSSEIKLKHT